MLQINLVYHAPNIIAVGQRLYNVCQKRYTQNLQCFAQL